MLKPLYFVAVILLFASCGNQQSATTGKGKEKTDTLAATAHPAYVCTMGKECGSSDKPGKCPSCGSEMVAAK